MRHLTNLVALVLLCLLNESLSNPIAIKERDTQMLFSYKAYTETGSNAHNDTIGRWSIEGYYTTQVTDNFAIYQLSNLKTSLFNGNRENLTQSSLEDIPKDAEVLLQPFMLNIMTSALYVAENEPLWSVNLKRAIAGSVESIEQGKYYENYVFGNCETNTEWKFDTRIVKTINHASCKGVPYQHKTNVHPAPGSEEYNPIKIETTIEIIISDELNPPNHHVSSLITYQPMPNDPFNQFIFQKQEIDFINRTRDFEPINTTSITEEKKIFFEYGDRTSQGRHTYETDATVLTQQYLDNFEKFEKKIKARPLENHRSTDDPIEEMYEALYNIPNIDGMKYLREKIENKSNWNLYTSFISLIPYVGTDQAVRYIYTGIIKENLENIPFYAIRLLATFPQYIRHPTNELVHSMEGMMDVENVKSDFVRSGRILSFASVVARANEQKSLDKASFEKFTKVYHEKFLASEIYKDKMMYLLGLVNMADGLSSDFMTSIITNNTLPNNIRSLALAGFKKALSNGNTDQVFNTFWPVVLDKKENFDVRVEALDLLLSVKLNQDQFNVILKKFTKYQENEIHDKHLANYFRSSLESYQNNTAYKYPIGDLATAAIENEEFETIIRPWTTGNYLVSFSDKEPNIGESYHARLIANPVLNTPSTIQLSYNDFAWSFDMGTYSVYLKVQGIAEYFFKEEFFHAVQGDTPIPDLVKLIKDHKFELKKEQQDFHVEIVVFVNDRAVFTNYFDHTDYDKQTEYFEDFGSQLYFLDTLTISYPVLDYTQMPSMLGTPINIMNDKREINIFSQSRNDLNYTSSWHYQIWLESYNSILDTTVSTYKYYGDKKSIDTKFSVNPKRMVAAWLNKNDSVNWALDKIIATTVDEKLLHKYCPSCEEIAEMPKTYDAEYIKDINMLGVKINGTSETFLDEEGPVIDNKEEDTFFFNFNNIHLSNSDAAPQAKPLLATLHFFKNWYYLKPELRKTLFRNLPTLEDGTMTSINFDFDDFTTNPFEDSIRNYSVNIMNKGLDENIGDDENYISNWFLRYEQIATYNYTDEDGKQKVKFTGNIYHTNEITNSSLFQICGTRNELLPATRSDKFSILPPEDTTAVHKIMYETFDNETDWDLYKCSDNHTITLTEEYTTLEQRTKNIKESEHYKKCLEDSKDFKYTPPTYSCLKTFMAMSQYDKHTIHAKVKDIPKIMGKDLDDNALYTAERMDDNKVKYKFLLSPLAISGKIAKYFEYIAYNTLKIKDPISDVYGDFNIISGLKRPCVITAKNIRSFVGRNIINNKNTEQVGFVECLEKGRRGLTFNKVSPTHVGFKFWSNDNLVDATVVGNKLKVTLNGKNLKESHTDENENRFSVRFLDEDVIFISDSKINIYYNTEYIFIKASSVYNDIICGTCSQQ